VHVCRAVSRHGEKNWSTVARTFNQLMGRPPLLGRAPKQCRSRYLQQLVPGIKTGEWSVEEEEILVEGHKQFGNQWTLIASMLPGRTETSVKNHYNCTARRWVQGLEPPGAVGYGDSVLHLCSLFLMVFHTSCSACMHSKVPFCQVRPRARTLTDHKAQHSAKQPTNSYRRNPLVSL
jgi:hypothetical protein